MIEKESRLDLTLNWSIKIIILLNIILWTTYIFALLFWDIICALFFPQWFVIR